MTPQDQMDKATKIALMRGHHFDFGNQPMTYETTAKEKFGNLSRFKQNTVTEPANNAKNDLRKHHFDFGA